MKILHLFLSVLALFVFSNCFYFWLFQRQQNHFASEHKASSMPLETAKELYIKSFRVLAQHCPALFSMTQQQQPLHVNPVPEERSEESGKATVPLLHIPRYAPGASEPLFDPVRHRTPTPHLQEVWKRASSAVQTGEHFSILILPFILFQVYVHLTLLSYAQLCSRSKRLRSTSARVLD